MSGSVVANKKDAAAIAGAFWEPRDASRDVHASTSPSAMIPSSVTAPSNRLAGVALPAIDLSGAAAGRFTPRHRLHHSSHHHSHHGEHGHRVRWRGRSKWPTYLKRSVAAVTVFTALLAWFWLFIGSCDPAFVAP